MKVGDKLTPEDEHVYEMAFKGKLGKFFLASKSQDWRIFLFYPLDFTFVCPTELLAFDERLSEFLDRNCSVYGVSVDSEHSHLAWSHTPRHRGGVDGIELPLVSDLTKRLSRRFGVLDETSGVAYRGLFILDPHGVVRIAHVNDLPIGRSVDEALRLVDALQFYEQHGEVCPANWNPGDKTMAPDPELSKKYFQQKELNQDVTQSDGSGVTGE